MEYKKSSRPTKNPESKIQERIKEHMEGNGFYVQVISGGLYQSGLPDLYAVRNDLGSLWIEVKTPKRAREAMGGLSPVQVANFKKMASHGAKIYILSSVKEYYRVFEEPNFYSYLAGARGQDCIGFKESTDVKVYGFQRTLRHKNK